MGDLEESKVSVDEDQIVAGSYKIQSNEDGVYVTVIAPKGGGAPVKESVIINALKAQNIEKFDIVLLSNTIEEGAGIPVKIAEKQELVEPEIQVLIDRDRMEAFLTMVCAPNSRPVTLDEVMDKIAKVGVSHGIDVEAVNTAINTPNAKLSFAKGTRPVDGTDARISLCFDLEKKGRPEELANGRVDFKDLNLFTVVNQGEVLAEKIPATPGTPGMDVLGQEVNAKSGKDVLMPVGKNTFAEDNKVIAAVAGQLQVIGNKITVSPVIEIKDDVDLSTGNVNFIGNVVIRGSVQSGFTVKADGNIEVYGSVSGGTLEGKNIVVHMGIQGMQRGYVKAKENVASKFIENATVSADGDVVVTDTILHSLVNAGKRVIVEGKRGLIAGGHVMAGEEVRAKTVGTQLAVATDLEVGVNPEIRDEYQILRKELKKNEMSLDQAQKSIVILKNVDQNELSPEKRELLLRLTKSQFVLAGQIDTMRKRITEIELIFEEARYGKIRVAETVFPGVKIVIGTLVKPIREPMKFTSFYAEAGDIKIGSFK